MDALYTVTETAEILRIGETTVRRYARTGTIPAVRFGRAIRFLPEVIERIRREGISEARRGRPRRAL